MLTAARNRLSFFLNAQWPLYLTTLVGMSIALCLERHATPFVLLLLLWALPQSRSLTASVIREPGYKILLLAAGLFFVVPSIHEIVIGQNHFAATAIKPLLCMILIMPLYYRVQKPNELLACILIAASLTVGAVAIYEHYVEGLARIGAGHNQIMFSIISVTIWLSALLHVPHIKNNGLKATLLGSAFACIPAILFSGSRTAWLAALLFSPLVLAWAFKTSDRQTRRWLLITLVAITPLAAAITLTDDIARSRLSATAQEIIQLGASSSIQDSAFSSSFGIRAGLTFGSIDVIQSSPLGIGLEGFYEYMQTLAANEQANSVFLRYDFKPHNQLLLMGVMFGWLGIICQLTLWGAMLWAPLKLRAQSLSRDAKHLYALAIFVSLGIMFYSQTDIPMSKNMPAVWLNWFYFMVLGLAMAAERQVSDKKAQQL
jgi:hypothetical protein